MESYLLYGGLVLAGWAIRHVKFGPDLSKFPILSTAFQLLGNIVGSPAATSAPVPVVAPASSVTLLSEAEQALLPLVKQLNAKLMAKAQQDLAALLNGTSAAPASAPGEGK